MDSYLSLGFSWFGDEDCLLPLCVVCGEKLPNEAMVLSKLKQHFTTKLARLDGKDLNYFKSLVDSGGEGGGRSGRRVRVVSRV
jgi:hypothetical protein